MRGRWTLYTDHRDGEEERRSFHCHELEDTNLTDCIAWRLGVSRLKKPPPRVLAPRGDQVFFIDARIYQATEE